jgi:hypothetical protein
MAPKRASIFLALVLMSASACATLGHFRGEDSFARGLALIRSFAASIPHFEAATREIRSLRRLIFISAALSSATVAGAAIQPL